MLQGIEIIFQDKNKMLKRLKKKLYEENTKEFVETYGHYFDEMAGCMKQAEDKEAAAKEIAVHLTESVKRTYANKRGRISVPIQMDLNLFMVYYVFPTILKKVEEGNILSDAICKMWNSTFAESSIQYADYETLHGSFKEKVFGIF